MRSLGFGVNADQAQGVAIGPDVQFQRRFREADRLFQAVAVQIGAQHCIKARRARGAMRGGGFALRVMPGLDPVRIIKEGDFLFGFADEADHRLARAQPDLGGKGFQGAGG